MAGADLVVDGDPGTEVLYVILSRTQLSAADPRLAVALAAKKPNNTPMDCGTDFEAKLAKPPGNASAAKTRTPSSTNVLRAAPVPGLRPRSAHAPGRGVRAVSL